MERNRKVSSLIAMSLRGEAVATSCQTMRLLHFVRNDTSCQIALSRSLSRTFVVRGSSQRHLGGLFQRPLFRKKKGTGYFFRLALLRG